MENEIQIIDLTTIFLLTLFRMGFFGAAHGWGGEEQKPPPLHKICHTYPTMMKLSTVTSYLKKVQERFESRDTPLEFCWHHHFFSENRKFAISRNTDIDCNLIHKFLFYLTFLELWKIVLINMVTIFMMSAKMVTPGLLKIKGFWNKGCDIIISVHDVANKILSRDSNYTVDVIMWPKIGNSSISMREVIITSIL